MRGAFENACNGHRCQSYIFDCCESCGCEENLGPVGDLAEDEISQSFKFCVPEIRVPDVCHQSASLA